MKDKFVTYNIAVLLYELGYDEPCMGNFANKDAWQIDMFEGSFNLVPHTNSAFKEYTISAPLWQDAIAWLKKKGVLVSELWDGWDVGLYDEDSVYFETKEGAILEAIKILKNK